VSIETILKTLASPSSASIDPFRCRSRCCAQERGRLNGLSDERVAELTSAGFACRVDAASACSGFERDRSGRGIPVHGIGTARTTGCRPSTTGEH
jgi:hypothetical protein